MRNKLSVGRGKRWIAVAVVAITGCGESEKSPRVQSNGQAAPTSSPAPAESQWTMQASATAGAAIVLTDEGGKEVFRLACRRSPADLYAAVPLLRRVGSEDRLTLGAGDELAVLVVSMEGPEEGLRATGARQPAFVSALAEGRAISFAYGQRQITLPPLRLDVRTDFAAACQDQAHGGDGGAAQGPAAEPAER